MLGGQSVDLSDIQALGSVAQLVEHLIEAQGVGSSILSRAILNNAGVV